MSLTMSSRSPPPKRQPGVLAQEIEPQPLQQLGIDADPRVEVDERDLIEVRQRRAEVGFGDAVPVREDGLYIASRHPRLADRLIQLVLGDAAMRDEIVKLAGCWRRSTTDPGRILLVLGSP